MKRYNLKKISAILMILSFGFLGLTGGFVSFFGREVFLLGIVSIEWHTMSAKLFIMMVGFHLFANYKVLLSYLGLRNALIKTQVEKPQVATKMTDGVKND